MVKHFDEIKNRVDKNKDLIIYLSIIMSLLLSCIYQ